MRAEQGAPSLFFAGAVLEAEEGAPKSFNKNTRGNRHLNAFIYFFAGGLVALG